MNLTEYELKAINGGFKVGIAVGIGAIIAFIAGILDGITRPLRCR